MADDLLRLLQEADGTPEVRCVVVTGAGDKAFSSGHDLTEVLGDSEAAVGPVANRAFIHPSKIAKPVIAAVNGPAYAGGFILALSCDLRVASRNATFCVAGVRIGLLPDRRPIEPAGPGHAPRTGAGDGPDGGAHDGGRRRTASGLSTAW